MKAYTGPMRFAHRGCVQDAPENTIGAFQGAVDHGFEGIEIDIQLSRDGEVIVAHDANFTRMTLGHPTHTSNARLCEMDWPEIEAIELPYANHTLPIDLPPFTNVEPMAIMPDRLMGQQYNSDYIAALQREPRMAHLMRFEDFDRWLCEKGGGITVEVEFKASGLAQKVLDIVARSPKIDQYILFSGSREYIDEIQRVCGGANRPKGLRLGANIRVLNEDAKARIAHMDLFEVGLNAERFEEDDILWLKDRGISVLSNLGDYPEWWSKLCKLSPLGFKTNYPEAFTRWWESNA